MDTSYTESLSGLRLAALDTLRMIKAAATAPPSLGLVNPAAQEVTFDMLSEMLRIYAHAPDEVQSISLATGTDASPEQVDDVREGSELLAYVMANSRLSRALDVVTTALPSVLNWQRNSRRVYALSEDLQLTLNATSVRGVTVKDIQLPQPVFLVKLAVPLKRDGQLFDSILVQEVDYTALAPGRKMLVFLLIRADLANYKIIPRGKFHILATKVAKRKGGAADKYNEIKHHLERYGAFTRFVVDANGDTPIATHNVQEASSAFLGSIGGGISRPCTCPHGHPEQDEAMRIVLGLMIYLQNLPAKQRERCIRTSEAMSSERDGMHGVNFDHDAVEVDSIITLSDEEREVLRGVMQRRKEVMVHFRDGHWRRRKGLGWNPLAKKTVQVRWTIVKRHLLAKGEVPAGGVKVL